MERSELVKYYNRVLENEEKDRKIAALKARKRELKQMIKTVENYKEILESQYESILDQLDYIILYF